MFERGFAFLEVPPDPGVHVNRFQFYNIFGVVRDVDAEVDRAADKEGAAGEAQFLTLPLFLFRVFAEPSRSAPSSAATDDAMLRANLYELFMVSVCIVHTVGEHAITFAGVVHVLDW